MVSSCFCEPGDPVSSKDHCRDMGYKYLNLILINPRLCVGGWNQMTPPPWTKTLIPTCLAGSVDTHMVTWCAVRKLLLAERADVKQNRKGLDYLTLVVGKSLTHWGSLYAAWAGRSRFIYPPILSILSQKVRRTNPPVP